MSTEPSHARSTAPRHKLFKCLALLLGLGAAVLLGEVGLRIALPGYLSQGSREREMFCRFDRELGWIPSENITAIHASDTHSSLVHQNQYGLRGSDDVELGKKPGRRRVLVLGDSYAWGFGVGQKELFSAPEVHKADVEILNHGVSGYGTDQEYLLYLRSGKRFEVDEVVLALTPYNDVGNNLESEQYGYLKPYFKLEGGELILHTSHIRERKLRSIGGWLRIHGRVWNVMGAGMRRLGSLLQRSKGVKNTSKAKKEIYGQDDVTPLDREGVELTVGILKKLKDAASAQKAEFSVIFIPYKPHIDHRLPTNHPLVPLLAAGLGRVGINYREPYPEFLKAAQAGARLFNDPDNHFGPEGHALFAKFLTGTEVAQASLNFYAVSAMPTKEAAK